MRHSQQAHSGAGHHNMTVVLFTLLGVLICGSLALSPTAQTKTSDEQQGVTPRTVPGRNGKIAFTSTRDGNHEIYTMEADGSNVQRLTNNPEYDTSPKWSPDGTKIAFVRSIGFVDDIYVMNADGTNQTRLTSNRVSDESPEWSPDGTRIVFQSNRDAGNFEIYVMNADGTNQTRLTNNPGRDGSPKWSPDGTRIVFERFRSVVEIHVMSADGSNQTQLTNSGHALSPRWSPDSSRIAFYSYRDGNSEIYVMNADGSNQTRLTNNTGLDESPRWSPDGTRIVFQSLRDNNLNIYMMNADGTNQTRLTNNTADADVSPIFSPDGTRIAFLSGYMFGDELIFSQIYVMNADGSSQTRLTNTAANVYEAEPDWQRLPQAAANPIDTVDFFVRQQYRDFLSREPEAGQPWSAILNNCPDPFNLDPNSPSASCDRIQVSASFFGSPEFRLKGFYVFTHYRVAFDRLADFAEIISDMQSVTGQTSADTAARRAAFPLSFVQRQEFRTRFDHLSDAAFVAALLERYELSAITTPDPQQPEGEQKVTLTRADLTSRLGGGMLSRAAVLRAIVESDEVAAAEYNRAFVAMQYYGYLRRAPEEAGYNDWLRLINHNPQDFRTMVHGFVNSIEYRARFGQP